MIIIPQIVFFVNKLITARSEKLKKNIDLVINKHIKPGVRYGYSAPIFRSGGVPKNNAMSVIIFILSYPQLKPTNISNYARVPDYHNIVRDFLEKIADNLKGEYPENSFKCYVDSSPFDEVAIAAAAGLGVIGENRLLISKEFGSFVFIGEIATDLTIETTDLTEKCIACNACKTHCFGALLDDEFLYERCLSHFSQSKGELNDWQKRVLKKSKMAWGCDRCQTVCPLNLGKTEEIYKPFTEDIFDRLTKENLQSAKDRAFFWRGDKPLIRNLDILEDEDEE